MLRTLHDGAFLHVTICADAPLLQNDVIIVGGKAHYVLNDLQVMRLDCYWSYHFEAEAIRLLLLSREPQTSGNVQDALLLLLSSEAQTSGNVQDAFNALLGIFCNQESSCCLNDVGAGITVFLSGVPKAGAIALI